MLKTFTEGVCPRCHEKIQVPDDREKIICMYFGKEILVKEALGPSMKADAGLYEEYKNLAMTGMERVIKECSNPMDGFKKDAYEGLMDDFYTSVRNMLEDIEYFYQTDDNPESWLDELSSHVVKTARLDIDSTQGKVQKNRRQLDLNFLVSVYLIPALLKYPAAVGDPLSDRLVQAWNTAFDASIGKASFEEINGGFRRKLCYITTAVLKSLGKGSDCPELQILKDYRDCYLETTEEGHALVEEYYNIAPTLVKRMDRLPDRDEIYEKIYSEYLAPCIHKIQKQDYESCRELYQEMVRGLEEKYMYQ